MEYVIQSFKCGCRMRDRFDDIIGKAQSCDSTAGEQRQYSAT